MPSFSPPLTLLVLILSLYFCISMSQRTERFGSARRILASIAEGEEENQQPLPKPKKKPVFDSKSPKADVFGSKKSSNPSDDEDHLVPKPKKKLISNTNTEKADTFDTSQSSTSSKEQEPKPKKKLTSSSNSPKADTFGTKKSLASGKEEDEEEEQLLLPKRKKKLISSSNTQNTETSSTDQEEAETQALPKPKKKLTFESKNQTKPLIKPKKTNSTIINNSIKKLNKTQNSTPKPSNSTKTQPKSTPNPTKKPQSKQPKLDQSLSWLEDETDGQDFMTEFRDLPSRLIPDLEKISTTSQAYLRKYNKEIEHNIRPFVGPKYAPTIASISSFLFLILPLLLATVLFRHLKGYLSIQRVLIFIQAYLAIYFATLSLTATVTGLEPLRFFYASAPETYAWTQAVQTLGYVLYLIVQLINLVVVFSSPANEFTAGARALGLAQMLVGLAVGLHYYVSVFHRAVTGEPPRANWKVHGIYALCFLVICAFARAERRKKAYLQDGGDNGKKS
ncbi:uncharacterized protein LOC120262014 [Dioscorea cayenensis subsp. rotundata]|uniref:Uncharacterized protein LOC120262014 n=1 Tax=Dioscorea cayennensis subsp. rotundata TaxID=55577 RepID=A0AB40BGJ8_DIOCR|nr:uncharacterized protein LOC120262014 [Dioscorea cayenensis subsp. rotundata]